MEKQSIIFLGSKSIGYECLQHLINERDHLHVEISGVLCNESSSQAAVSDLRKLAQAHQIPVFSSPDEMPEADFLYSVQYHQILNTAHIAKARQIALNLHMAPLPEYRGCNQFSFAILDGKKEFGTTIHQLDEKIDHGSILYEKRFAIPDACWIGELYDITYAASLLLFKETLPDIISKNYTLTSQQALESERGTHLHYRKEIEEIKKIDLNWDQEKIQRHIRATAMPGFEPPYTTIGNQKIYFCTKWK